MSELFSDCNLNVARRFLDEFRCEHPHLKTIALDKWSQNIKIVLSLRLQIGALELDAHFTESVNFLNTRRHYRAAPELNGHVSYNRSQRRICYNDQECGTKPRRIENDNFQTLNKMTGCSLEHNFDHGKTHIALLSQTKPKNVLTFSLF